MVNVLCRNTAKRCSLGMDTVKLPKNDHDLNVISEVFSSLKCTKSGRNGVKASTKHALPGTNVMVIGKKQGCFKMNEEHL